MRTLRTWIEIDASALRHNVAEFRKLIGSKVRLMAVVKSNAYGHGLVLTAKALLALHRFSEGGWFGVDSIVEALRLRREGIKNPILVLGYTLPSRLGEAAAKRVTVTVSNFEALEAIVEARRRPEFHLKLDTGMHRTGFQEYEIPRLISVLRTRRLNPSGMFSHLAYPEDRRSSERQVACFDRCLKAFASAGVDSGIRHLSGSGGVCENRPLYDMVRVGFSIYGYLRRAMRRPSLRPVLAWKTMVAEVKQIKKGERIGYDFTERLRRDSTIVILPVGYWHGYDRGLSRIGEVLIRGRRAKVMGRVSMDMIAVDVTGVRGVRIGDEAVLIGWQGRPFDVAQGREFIGADEIAEKLSTSPYEVLTRINPLIRREMKK